MMTAVIEIVKKLTKADISISGDITAKTHEAAQAAEVIASLTRGEKKL
jgi:glycine cleavage system H lipoate-binding protein